MSADLILAPAIADPTITDIASPLCDFIRAPDHFWAPAPKATIQTRRRAGGYLSMLRRRLWWRREQVRLQAGPIMIAYLERSLFWLASPTLRCGMSSGCRVR
jgi:hypothetical protein